MSIEGVKKHATYEPAVVEQVLKNLQTLAHRLKECPNTPLPDTALDHIYGATQLIIDAGGVVTALKLQVAKLEQGTPCTITGIDSPQDYTQMVKDLQALIEEETAREGLHADLLVRVLNNMVVQLRTITDKERQIEELRRMAFEREEELARVRGELHVALGGRTEDVAKVIDLLTSLALDTVNAEKYATLTEGVSLLSVFVDKKVTSSSGDETAQKDNTAALLGDVRHLLKDPAEETGSLPKDFFFNSIFKDKGAFLAAKDKKQFLDALQSTAMTLNSMAVEGLPYQHQKALTDAFGLIQSIATDNKIVYLLDWRRQVISPEKYREMLKELELLIAETNNPSWKYKELSVTVFNTLVAQKKTIEEQEQKLKEAHIELQHLKKTFQAAEEEDLGIPDLLAPEQRGAENGFWIISREWHEFAIKSHDIDLRQRSGRDKYLVMLRHDVAKLAKAANPEGVNSIATMMVMVEWDSYMDAEEQGDKRFGPAFCSGTLKLLPEQNKPAKPVTPVEPPCAIVDKFTSSGLFKLNEDWRHWFMTEYPNYANLDRIPNRNYMRAVLGSTVGRMLKVTDKAPVIIIDWDAAATIGDIYFAIPEHDPKAFKVALNNL